jgi:hypothetical protein
MSEERSVGVIMKTKKKNTEQKLPYEKPKMTAVSLFADEVLVGCGKKLPTLPGCQRAGES